MQVIQYPNSISWSRNGKENIQQNQQNIRNARGKQQHSNDPTSTVKQNHFQGAQTQGNGLEANLLYCGNTNLIPNEREKQLRATAQVFTPKNKQDSNIREINPNNLIELLGDQYNPRMHPDENLINAIRNNIIPKNIPIILRDFVFCLPMHKRPMDVPVIPGNIRVDRSCKVRSGALAFCHGEITADGPDVAIYARGGNCRVYANAIGSIIVETVKGATTINPNNLAIRRDSFEALQRHFAMLETKAKADDVEAAYTLGALGTSELFLSLCDAKTGASYLHRAGAQNHNEANHTLGLIALRDGNKSNDEYLYRAREYFLKAHKNDHAESTFMLGELYSNPVWASKEFGLNGMDVTGGRLGYSFYKKAAEKNHQGAKEKMEQINMRKFSFNTYQINSNHFQNK